MHVATRTPSDDLREIASQLCRWLTEHKMTVAHASFYGRRSETSELRLHANQSEAWRHFAEVAHALDARVIALDMGELTAIELAEAYAAAETVPDETEREQRRRELREHECRVGQVYRLAMTAFPPNGFPLVQLRLYAPWMDVVFAHELETEPEEPRPTNAPEPEDDPYLRQLARRLAEESRFQDAKHGQHDYVARLILEADPSVPRDLLGARQLWPVVSLAKQIWEIELKPERDEARRKRALELQAQGLPKTRIAAELGMSSKQLTNLIR